MVQSCVHFNTTCTCRENKLTLFTPMKKSSESVGAGGGLGSPPRRLRLADPLVWCWRASLPSGVVGSTSFQLNTTRVVWACSESVINQLQQLVYCYVNFSPVTYHDVSVSVITCGPVPGELQNGVSTSFLPIDQKPVLARINGRQGLSFSISVLQVYNLRIISSQSIW